jgi:hypothetical protein
MAVDPFLSCSPAFPIEPKIFLNHHLVSQTKFTALIQFCSPAFINEPKIIVEDHLVSQTQKVTALNPILLSSLHR